MNQAAPDVAADQSLLQTIYNLMGQRGTWPTFTAVDLQADRELGIEDAQAALIALPAEFLSRPWHAHGFSDGDEVRLKLRGVAACDGGAEDLALLDQFVAWVVALEQGDTSGAEDPLLALSADFAAHLGLPAGTIEPNKEGSSSEGLADASRNVGHDEKEGVAQQPGTPEEIAAARARLSRVRVLADLLPNFWGGIGWQQDAPWVWQYRVDRRRVRPYRRIRGVQALLEYVDSQDRERAAGAAVAVSDSKSLTVDGPMAPTRGGDLDILLTVLREEIIEASAKQLRENMFDDAIFAAFRRVEHELQQRTGNPSIGNDLIRLAFLERKEPIRITEREKDKDRLVELFGGAIGLFKGDRSHKDRPQLPCRSRHECLRLLAHASTLLDLLDRDIALAPAVRGYEHRQGNTLTLLVDRAGSQVDVWLDETIRLDKLSFQPGTLVVDVTGVSPGEHRIHLVEGHRQGAAHTVWLTSDPGLTSWYRVREVNLPLYGDESGQKRLDLSGVRLSCLENGVASERVVPTRDVYQVGHYVTWHWSTAVRTGPIWTSDRLGMSLSRDWDESSLFDGQPVAPAHVQRLMHISMQPSHLRLRRGDKVPLRVLAHFTDGTATWTEPVDNPQVETGDEEMVFFKGGKVFANGPGSTTLRCLHDGLSAVAAVEVAAHPRGTMTELLTGLPPVAGIACTASGLVVSTRGTDLWRVGLDGVYRLVAATPQATAGQHGTDTLAARQDGELAVRLVGRRAILVLHRGEDEHKNSDYCSSRLVEPDCPGVPMAFAWHGEDLIVAMDSGMVHRVAMSGAATPVATVEGIPVALVCSGDVLLVLCSSSLSSKAPNRHTTLWRITDDRATTAVDLLADSGLNGLGGVACRGDDIYVSDFEGGRILRLSAEGGENLTSVADGLTNPGQLAIDGQGTLYIAEFGAGAVRRVFS